MAYSTQRAVSDGTLQLLMISIEFFDRSEITAYLDNVPTTAFTWASDKVLRFNSVVPSGVEVLLRRTTDLSQVRHVFSLGAQFKDATLDDDFTQILHIAQEAVEGANVGDIYSTLNMHGNKITNVGLAVDPGDAISFGQVITESQSAFAAALAAQQAATNAAASQGVASAAAGTATAQAGIATTAAGTATTAAGTSTTQAGVATTQAGIATTAAGTATTQAGISTTQAGNSANSAILAQKWAAEPEDSVVSAGLYSAYHYSRKAADSAASAKGVSIGYIDGFRLVYTGRTSLTVGTGTAIAGGTWLNLTADKVFTGLTLLSRQFYHAYLFDSGAGVADVELSTTAPTRYYGTAYQKTGDASRRYLGSALTNGSGQFVSFTHNPLAGVVTYTEGDHSNPPFNIHGVLTQPTPILISTVFANSGNAALVPREPGTALRCLVGNSVAYTLMTSQADQVVAPSTTFWGNAVGSNSPGNIPMVITPSRAAATLGQYYVWTPVGSCLIYGISYEFER